MSKGLLLLSGGLDSVTLLYEYKEVVKTCLFAKVASRASDIELALAEKLCKELNKELIVVDLNGLFQTSKVQSLKFNSPAKSVRNGVLIMAAANLAASANLDTVYIGVLSEVDSPIYTDCSSSFLELMSLSVKVGTGGKVKLEAPFTHFSKEEVGKLYIKHRIPFEYSYSCYKGGEKHCGECSSCKERKTALALYDKTVYETKE